MFVAILIILLISLVLLYHTMATTDADAERFIEPTSMEFVLNKRDAPTFTVRQFEIEPITKYISPRLWRSTILVRRITDKRYVDNPESTKSYTLEELYFDVSQQLSSIEDVGRLMIDKTFRNISLQEMLIRSFTDKRSDGFVEVGARNANFPNDQQPATFHSMHGIDFIIASSQEVFVDTKEEPQRTSYVKRKPAAVSEGR